MRGTIEACWERVKVVAAARTAVRKGDTTMMNLIHERRAYRITEVEPRGRQGVYGEDVATGQRRFFFYANAAVVFDPTDDQYFACVNVRDDVGPAARKAFNNRHED